LTDYQVWFSPDGIHQGEVLYRKVTDSVIINAITKRPKASVRVSDLGVIGTRSKTKKITVQEGLKIFPRHLDYDRVMTNGS
jgi:hypothetical protein